ncbi:pentapeptide repeat-containing protein [Streptomyces sp. NPDC059349]|uniref:pentapeptide repeat-containing protein n=1 Tax=Streptomyces sp. NPDC059349 TaxID=3346808 RepID=UPI00369A9503
MWLVAPLALIAVGALAFGLYLGAEALLTSENTTERPVDVQDVIKTTVTVITLMGAVLAGVYAYRKQLLSEGDSHRADASQLAERYSTAAEQLGHEQAAVRLAGVYAMARLADDWLHQRQVCVDVLCAYLRMPYETDPAQPRFKAGEREVRLNIVRIISDHLQNPQESTAWCHLDWDFSGAIFDGGSFISALFTGAVSFDGARFVDNFSFDRTQFTGGVSLRSARFTKRASFFNAEFSGRAFFNYARFTGAASFDSARFIDTASFDLAQFTRASFFGARFTDAASFYGTRFSENASFDTVEFTGDSSFDRAEFTDRASFSGARSTKGITFTRTNFSGEATFSQADFAGEADFYEARFFDSVDFWGAHFTGAVVSFYGAELAGGSADFANASVHTATHVDWGPFPPIPPNVS